MAKHKSKSASTTVDACPKTSSLGYNMVRYGRAYQRQSEADELAAHRDRMEKNLRRRAKQLGYELTKIGPPEGEVPATGGPSVA